MWYTSYGIGGAKLQVIQEDVLHISPMVKHLVIRKGCITKIFLTYEEEIHGNSVTFKLFSFQHRQRLVLDLMMLK